MFGQAAQAGSTSGAPAFESAPTIPDADNGIAAAAGTGVEPALAPDSPVENMKDALPGLLKRIVSDRTGYPLEIIDLNADLEADLGIDSIKRVEILGTLRQSAGGLDELNLEALTPQRTLQQIIDVILAESGRAVDTGAGESDDAPPSSGASVTEAAPVVWGTVSRFTPGEEIVVQRTFDPAEDSWLRDHVFGRDVSLNDPSLLGLPVMPLAVSIELMAQAAAALKPGSVVARVEKVRASRWVGFESGVQTVQVRARVSGLDKSRVMVELRNLTEDESAGSPLGPAAEATVVMAPSFEMAPLPLSMSGIDGVQLGGGHYYEDVLFHGPAWRVLDRIEANGSDGATAEVSVPGRDVFTHMGDSACILDPVMVDAGGQILGCWAAENLSEGSRVLPLGAESIELYGPAPRPGDVLTFLLKVEDVAAQTIRADFDIVGARGLYMRVRGWTSRRFHFPSHLLPLSAPGALPHISAAVQVDGLSEEAREASEARSVEIETVDNAAFLARIWSLRILSRRERGVSSGGFGSGSDLRQIAGLHVAKEAARLLLQRTYEYEVLPADIELQSQDDSTFLATGSWNGSVGKTLKVWLAQDGGRSVALASLAPDLIDNPAEVVRDLVLRAPVVDKSSNGHYK
jgi:acyl carrier protein